MSAATVWSCPECGRDAIQGTRWTCGAGHRWTTADYLGRLAGPALEVVGGPGAGRITPGDAEGSGRATLRIVPQAAQDRRSPGGLGGSSNRPSIGLHAPGQASGRKPPVVLVAFLACWIVMVWTAVVAFDVWR